MIHFQELLGYRNLGDFSVMRRAPPSEFIIFLRKLIVIPVVWSISRAFLGIQPAKSLLVPFRSVVFDRSILWRCFGPPYL